MNPLLSVVIPSYNGERFVAAAIRSVLGQSYRPLELVVVDDGSTDASRAVIRQACAEPGDVAVTLVDQENQGAHAAIMRGLELARGEVLSILNCDDLYHEQRFSRLVPRLAVGTGVVFSDLVLIDAHGRALPPDHGACRWYANARDAIDSCPTVGYALLLHNFSVTSGNFVFTRELYRRLGGFASFRFVHDWDFLMRSVYYAEPLFVPERLMRYRFHDANTSESVRGLLCDEAGAAIGRYFSLCATRRPPNTLAPCAENWPRLFPSFIARHAPFFAPERSWAELLAEAGWLAASRPARG